MQTNKSPIIAAVDIGTTKICAVIGRRDQHGRLEVLGVGKVESEGVMRGVVSNIEKTVKAIKEAADSAREQSGLDFDTVHVGIAGQHIKSLQHRGMMMRESTHNEISRRDIDRLISDMHKLVLPPGDKILHVIPQEYTVDNEQGIVDPIGMSGIKLEANFHIITGQITASNNIHRCVERAGLRTANVTLEPIASAASVLYEDEKQAGVALVDIGGGTTDITIFEEGIIRHTAVIPFGGNVITKDIKEGCNVMDAHAEKLKVKYGSALAEEVYENRIIAIPGLRGREPKEISEKNLSRIIQARAEEILDYVMWEIRRSGYERKLIGGIVLTGGGALLRDIDKLTELHTGLATRIGTPVEHLAHGYSERLTSPIYSTSLGLLLKGFEDFDAGRVTATALPPKPEPKQEEPVAAEAEMAEEGHGTPWLESIFRKTKEWFEAEPDTDFR
ncbi:MAG: cell division protein FtsA [Saprospiraceae bacterium]